jgi:AraC-like DNA-binding protein
MKIPYHFDFNGNVKHREILSSLPEGCRHPMPAAKSRLYYLWNDTEILSQQLNRTPFFTEMVEVDIKKTTEIPFVVYGTQIFLFFMISGEVTFQEDEGSPIVVTRNNTFMISVYGSGRFTFKAEAGKHVAFIVNIQRQWMEKESDYYPKVWAELNENSDRSYFTLNQYRIDRKVKRWLRRIYSYPKEDKGSLEGHLIKYIGYILNYYDTRIQEEDPNLADQLKKYIEENFCDPKLNVEMLAEKFSVTRFTLLNHFKRKYKVSVQEFYLRLRLSRARVLLKRGNSMADIFYQVGFRDESSLRKALLRSSPNKK